MTGDQAEAIGEIVCATVAVGVMVVTSSTGHPVAAFGAFGALVIVAASSALRRGEAGRARPEVPRAPERPREAPETAGETRPQLYVIERIAA